MNMFAMEVAYEKIVAHLYTRQGRILIRVNNEVLCFNVDSCHDEILEAPSTHNVQKRVFTLAPGQKRSEDDEHY